MLPKKEREELYSRMQKAWEIINKRFKDNKDIFEKESLDNYKKVRLQLNSVKSDISKYADLKNLSQTLKDQQAFMKGKKFKKENRTELFNEINYLFSQIFKLRDEMQRDYERDCENNKIYVLDKLNGFYISETINFKEKRNYLKETQQWMKGKKFKKDDREYI